MREINIKNIIFDLGGVLIDLDYQRCLNAFQQLGFSDVEKYLSRTHPTGFFKLMEKGEISVDEFVDRINEANNSNTSKDDVISAWNSFLDIIPEERLKLLSSLKSKYRLFLLSNTSPSHAEVFEKMFHLNGQMSGMSAFFEDVFYSFNIGFSKPSEESYLTVLSKAKIVPEETLFIDDSEINTVGANKLGIHTITVNEDFDVRCINFDQIDKNKYFTFGAK